jgi:cytochrome c2
MLLLALASTQAPCEGGREGGQQSVGPLLSQVLGKDVVNFQQKELSEVPAEGWGEEG